jgi:hypothetical protein
MENEDALMNQVFDNEDIARMLFSPLFICDGVLSQKAFTLEKDINETYISVLRPIISSFEGDMEGIKKEGNILYGYALLNVGELRNCKIKHQKVIKFDVLPRNSGRRKSHAGIFTTIDNVKIKGGMPQTVERMLARMFLVNIAQKRVCEFE